MNVEADLPSKGVEVADLADIGPLAVDLQVPGLATLVTGTFRSTARAGQARASRLVPSQVHYREAALLLDVCNTISVYSDLL